MSSPARLPRADSFVGNRTVRYLAAADAALLLLLAYWIEFGGGLVATYRAARSAAPTSQGNRVLTTAQMAQWLAYWSFLILLSLLAITVAMWLIGPGRIREWFVGRQPAIPGGALLTVGVVWVTLKLPLLLFLALGTPGSTVSTAPWWYELGSGTLAGIGEELVVVAAPLVVTRFVAKDRRFPPIGVWLILIAARLAYHLYYGVWVALISFTLWAAATVWVYWLVGRVWPLVLAHLCIYLPNVFRIPYGVQIVGLFLLGVVLVIVGAVRWRRATRPAAPPPAVMPPGVHHPVGGSAPASAPPRWQAPH